jgi:hypothetical protein
LSPQDRKQIVDAARVSYNGYKAEAAADLSTGVDRMSQQTGLPPEQVGRFMYGAPLWNQISGAKGVDNGAANGQPTGKSGVFVDPKNGSRWKYDDNGKLVPAA